VLLIQRLLRLAKLWDKDEGAAVDSEVTPATKALGKRSADRVESLDDLAGVQVRSPFCIFNCRI